MPSSSSPAQQRRRQLRGRKPLDRAGSSFLGSLKSIVTAPLSWFSNTDEFEESQDLQGKRRRVATAPTELLADNDAGPPRNKRMRMNSPPRPSYQVNPPVSGYNDPPANVFQGQLQPSYSLAPRSASVSFPLQASKSYGGLGSSKRVAGPPRNTSIDPPGRVPSTSFGLKADGSMDVSAFNRITVRDTSLPPAPGRSFVMRTSMTPQPQLRELSEPPSLSSLAHNPTFVRAPSQQRVGGPQGMARQPSITLGTLAESARSTKALPRQHSLLFPTDTNASSEATRANSTIEKALHDLDVYRTPLVPTRLRSSRSSAAMTTSDMFKNRRRSLILMQDEKPGRSKGRKDKEGDDVTNDTKPYAGRGGMKKLLARRKQEVAELQGRAADEDADQSMEQDEEPKNQPKTEAKAPAPVNSTPVPAPLPPMGLSPFQPKPVAPSSEVGSSLRVGRSKRNHIARPAVRPSKMKFSAVYDDDDDNMEDDEEEAARRKEKEELEAAAKRAPVFNIPAGFSFAKPDAVSIKHDTSTAKEPALPSLPFSLFKAAPPAQANTSNSSTAEERAQVKPPSFSVPAPGGASPFSFATPTQTETPTPTLSTTPLAATPVPTSGGGVPNFFASSSIFSKPLDVAKPPPLMFSGAPSDSPPVIEPVKETEKSASSGFFGQKIEAPVSESTPSFFSASQVTPAPSASGTQEPVSAPAVEPKPLFSQPTQPFSFSTQPTTSRASEPAFSFGAPAPPSSENKTTDAPSSSLFGNSAKPPSLFSAPPAVTVTPATELQPSQPAINPPAPTSSPFSFGQSKAPVAETPAPTGFSFGQPSSSTTTPKPLFGDDSKPKSTFEGFSFSSGNREAEPKPASTPFTFGAVPSTPSPAADKKPAFSFGAAASTTPSAPPPITFSFSAGSTGSTDGTNPFSFGQSAASTPIERPVTPPRNQDQEVNMDESPVREVIPENKPFGGPSLNGNGFSFGSQSNGNASGFAFGNTSASNPFAKNDKPAGSTLFGTSGSGFGASNNTTSAGFSFGQNGDNGASRPSTGGSFFGSSAPAEQPKVSAPFTFGGPGNTSSGGGFGQASGSAPNSPSTFSQSSPFSFGAPLPPVQTSFSFGSSQPASPATSNSGLPQPSFGGGFGQSQPSPAAASPGGALFTMGSSAAPTPAASGSRQIKKLPRRGGKR